MRHPDHLYMPVSVCDMGTAVSCVGIEDSGMVTCRMFTKGGVFTKSAGNLQAAFKRTSTGTPNVRLTLDWDAVKAEDKTLVHQVTHRQAPSAKHSLA